MCSNRYCVEGYECVCGDIETELAPLRPNLRVARETRSPKSNRPHIRCRLVGVALDSWPPKTRIWCAKKGGDSRAACETIGAPPPLAQRPRVGRGRYQIARSTGQRNSHPKTPRPNHASPGLSKARITQRDRLSVIVKSGPFREEALGPGRLPPVFRGPAANFRRYYKDLPYRRYQS